MANLESLGIRVEGGRAYRDSTIAKEQRVRERKIFRGIVGDRPRPDTTPKGLTDIVMEVALKMAKSTAR